MKNIALFQVKDRITGQLLVETKNKEFALKNVSSGLLCFEIVNKKTKLIKEG